MTIRQCCRIVKKVKPQRTPEQVREVLKQDQRTNRFDLLKLRPPCAYGECHSIEFTLENLFLGEQQNRCNRCTEIAVIVRI